MPQVFARVDRDKVLKQGVNLSDVYQTLQAFMGGVMVNYFNRFGRTWQVYVEAEGEFRTQAENVGQFYVLNNAGDMVPLSALVTMETFHGPEFTMRYNEYRSAQLLWGGARLQFRPGDEGVGGGLCCVDAGRYGVRLHGHVVPGEGGLGRRAGERDLRLLAALCVSDPCRTV